MTLAIAHDRAAFLRTQPTRTLRHWLDVSDSQADHARSWGLPEFYPLADALRADAELIRTELNRRALTDGERELVAHLTPTERDACLTSRRQEAETQELTAFDAVDAAPPAKPIPQTDLTLSQRCVSHLDRDTIPARWSVAVILILFAGLIVWGVVHAAGVQ